MKYEKIVNDLAQEVFDAIAPRVTPEDMERVRQAYLLAKEAHAPQRRKSGEPYILHPISVALIVAKENARSNEVAVEFDNYGLKRMYASFAKLKKV
mgnify:CR=1 FL=1